MSDFLSLIHGRLATAALYYFLIVALWGYFRFFRKQGIDSSYWGMLAIGEILVLAQALLGVFLWVSGHQPARGWLHVLYGSLIPAMIPLAYFYTRGRTDRRDILVYGTVTLITAGLVLRAIYTAQVAL
ncbi:MAG TPA: hypothetical protein VI703_03150 [Anaerolineales bacterium]|jgi:hypothetical protein|nr:hypothetical protein [Anaerolineales bacterium]